MYKNYLIDYSLRNFNNHPLSACKWNAITINTTNNNIVQQQKEIMNVIIDLILTIGQFPQLKKAKKNVSAFGVRKNMLIGTKITINKKNINYFFKKFIFSIIPHIKIWENKKVQKNNKNLFTVNFGFKNLMSWFELKNFTSTGLHIQFIIKQLNKNKDFLFFLSKFNIKLPQ